jgi:hypothetical protein
MPWCKVNVTFAGTGYDQNYKRQLAVHSHPLSQQFTVDAMNDAVGRINANLPAGQQHVTTAQLGLHGQADQLTADPGRRFRLI